jgi:hypothetical protein
MPQISFAIIVFLTVLSPLRALAQAPASTKTRDLLILSGGQSEERLKATSLLKVDDNGYLAYGILSVAPRARFAQPQDIVIWGRGMSGLSFFELTPLLGVFENPQTAAELRNSLLSKGSVKSRLPDGTNDRQRLEFLAGQATPLTSKTLQWQRQVALAQMRFFNLSDFDQLFEQYQKEKIFAQSPETGPTCAQMSQLLGSPVNSGSEALGWASFIKFLGDHKLSSSVLRTKISSTLEPKLIGYIRRVPSAGVTKVAGQIFVAADGAEPESIPAALEIETEESFFAKAMAGIPITLVTTLVGLGGALGGAAIGYKFFLYQQNRLRRWEVEKQFADKKVELSKKILKFFRNDYDNLRNNQDPEIDRVTEIRNTLVDEDIYAILLSEEIVSMNNICDPASNIAGSRLEALDQLLRKNFKEFMV